MPLTQGLGQFLAGGAAADHFSSRCEPRQMAFSMREVLSGPYRTRAIAEKLVVTAGVVEKHIASIFAKLGLAPSDTDNRRVIAGIKYLESLLSGSQRSGSRCQGSWQ